MSVMLSFGYQLVVPCTLIVIPRCLSKNCWDPAQGVHWGADQGNGEVSKFKPGALRDCGEWGGAMVVGVLQCSTTELGSSFFKSGSLIPIAELQSNLANVTACGTVCKSDAVWKYHVCHFFASLSCNWAKPTYEVFQYNARSGHFRQLVT